MIIPVRCYSCGKCIAHLYEPYKKLLDEDYTEAEALQAVGAVRYCCRRMLLTHIDLIDGLMPYSSPVVGTMQRLRAAGVPNANNTNNAAQQAQQRPAQN
jgi:DNA-directed RNA polymerases I, II, and III subunit RPABC5